MVGLRAQKRKMEKLRQLFHGRDTNRKERGPREICVYLGEETHHYTYVVVSRDGDKQPAERRGEKSRRDGLTVTVSMLKGQLFGDKVVTGIRALIKRA